MNQPHFLLKVTAVVSSALLAGGYVCYRAGAFDDLVRTAPSLTGTSPDPTKSQDRPHTTKRPKRTIIPSTKASPLHVDELAFINPVVRPPAPQAPSGTGQPTPPTHQAAPTGIVIMSGSKSSLLSPRVNPDGAAIQGGQINSPPSFLQPRPSAKDAVRSKSIMGGSKSIILADPHLRD